MTAFTVRRPGFRIGPSFEARFSRAGDRLVTFGDRLVLWDVESRERLGSAHPFSHPSAVDFSPDGRLLAVKNTSGEIAILDAESLDVVVKHDGRPWGEGAGPLFSPCGEYLVDGSWNGDLVVRSVMSGEVVWHDCASEMVSEIRATPDRLLWLHNGFGGITVRPWPFTEASSGRITVVGQRHFAVAAGGRWLCGASPRGIGIWDLKRRRWKPTAKHARLDAVLDAEGTIRSIAWSPTGGRVAVATPRAVRLLDADLQMTWETPLVHACHVEFSPSGNLLACGAWSKGFVMDSAVAGAG